MPSKKKEVCCSPRSADLRLPNEVAKGIEDIGGLDELLGLKMMDKDLIRHSKENLAMADKKRLMIMMALVRCDLCPCVLKEVTGLTDSKLSYHLSILEKVGFIGSKQSRNWRIYSITKKGREGLIRSGLV